MNTTTPTAARLTMPTRLLTGATGKPARYTPAVKTDIRATFAKFERLQRLQARRQCGAVAHGLLDVLTAAGCAAGIVALLLHGTDALAATPAAAAAATGSAPHGLTPGMALAALVVVVLLAVLAYAVRAYLQEEADNEAYFQRRITEIRSGLPAEQAGAHARADERGWARLLEIRGEHQGGAQ